MTAFARFIFETSPFDPLTTALLAGFAALDWYGKPYLTAAGEAYLESLG